MLKLQKSCHLQRMKELFRELDITRVHYFKGILEQHGIPTMIRNEFLTGAGLTEIPIPEFYPALCVMNDDDFESAVEIIRDHLTADQGDAEREVVCVSCGETNPGNFDTCWSCGRPVVNANEVRQDETDPQATVG